MIGSRVVNAACFTVGGCLALLFSWDQVEPVLDKYRLIPAIVASDEQPLEFTCKDATCVACLQGVRDDPRALVFTGGSAFTYALDLDELSRQIGRPVVNCIKNDSRVDAYRLLFEYRHFNQPDQLVVHGYNSWGINSPGTWVGKPLGSFFVMQSADDGFRADVGQVSDRWAPYARLLWRARKATQLSFLLANIFLTREMAETPLRWRIGLVETRHSPVGRLGIVYWPLSKEAHLERQLGVMKRWFGLSAWVHSFLIDMDAVRPAAEIAARHEAFLAAAAPTARFVFFPAPELTEIFPAPVRRVMDRSKAVMLDVLSKNPSVQLVDVDYRACGVVPDDFWRPVAMAFDPAHVDPSAKPKITRCIVDAFRKANMGGLGS